MVKIKILQNKDSNNFMDCNDNLPKDRSFVYNFGVYFHLQDDLHFWLTERNIQYKLIDELGWYLIFENKKDAILFKLTWC